MASPQMMQLLAEQREAFVQGFASGFVELARLQCREVALAEAGRKRQAETSAADEQAGAGAAGEEASAFDNVKAKIQPQPEAECNSHHHAMEERDGTFHAVRGLAACRGWLQDDADTAAGGLGGSAAASSIWQLVEGRWLRDHLDVETSDAIDTMKVLAGSPCVAVQRAETPEEEGEAAVRTVAGMGAPDIPAVARAAGLPLPGVLSGTVSLESLEKAISPGKGDDDPDGSDRRGLGPTATGPSSERSGCDDSGVKQLGWAIQAEEPLPGQPGQATRKANTLVVPITRGQRHKSEKGNMQSIQKESTCAMDYNSQRESILDVKLAATAMRVPSDELRDCGDGSSIGECESPHSSWNKGDAFTDSASRGPCHIVRLQRSDCAAESDADEQQPGPDEEESDYGQKEAQEEPNGRGDTVGADACAESTGGGEAAASAHHENEHGDEECEEIDELASSFWHRALNTVENELGSNGVAAAVQCGKELTCLRHPKLVPRKQSDGVYVCRTALVREIDGEVVFEVKVRASGGSMSNARDSIRVALLHTLVQQIALYISEALEDEGESSEVQARAKAFLDGRVARAHRAAVLPVQLRTIELNCTVPY